MTLRSGPGAATQHSWGRTRRTGWQELAWPWVSSLRKWWFGGRGWGIWEGPHSAAGGTGLPGRWEAKPHMATPVFPSSWSLGVPENTATLAMAKGTAGSCESQRAAATEPAPALI